jgi:hypothetical protein
MTSYRVALAIIGVWCGVHTMAIISDLSIVGFAQLYLLVTPYVGLVLGYWFHQERQIELLGKALDSFIRSKAPKSELTSQQDK